MELLSRPVTVLGAVYLDPIIPPLHVHSEFPFVIVSIFLRFGYAVGSTSNYCKTGELCTCVPCTGEGYAIDSNGNCVCTSGFISVYQAGGYQCALPCPPGQRVCARVYGDIFSVGVDRARRLSTIIIVCPSWRVMHCKSSREAYCVHDCPHARCCNRSRATTAQVVPNVTLGTTPR